MKSFIHHQRETHPDISLPDPHQDAYSRTVLGFWMYLMTDCIVFATLFATYVVLHTHTFGGPTAKDLFSVKTAFIETMILLFSSAACGMAVIAAKHSQKIPALIWLSATFLLGISFVALELHEFADLAMDGHSWTKSAFLSSFFTLVGTHGLHVSFGLIWIVVMLFQVLIAGITIDTFRRLVIFSMFWHFLDLVWIFIFTIVYLLGVM
jgi:cytochrome o ubiquinol oxidase subunit III